MAAQEEALPLASPAAEAGPRRKAGKAFPVLLFHALCLTQVSEESRLLNKHRQAGSTGTCFPQQGFLGWLE